MNSPGYLRFPQLNNAIVDETTPEAPAPCHGFPYVTVYVTGTGTINAGVITIETADYDPQSVTSGYAGTWSAITTVNAVDVTAGAQKHVPLTTASYAFIRTRVSTAIGGGGSVSTMIVAA